MWVNEALISTVPQVLFDHVVERLVLQGRRSLRTCPDGAVHCVYRDDEGRRCALGHCFTDAMHACLATDAGSIRVLLSCQVITGPSFYLQDLLESLQNAHDDSETRDDWAGSMKEVACRYALSPKKLVELANPAWVQVASW